jgi:hypothetical protein
VFPYRREIEILKSWRQKVERAADSLAIHRKLLGFQNNEANSPAYDGGASILWASDPFLSVHRLFLPVRIRPIA